ncbi:MAG: GNAT family N-acetyltransferase [Ruminococcaceae bacterium]|nr:GNAT family N-acetyltransferase [Oscillospiraceae bacterium]
MMDLTKIELLGIDRVLRRGTGEVVEQDDDALLVRDAVSGAYFLACDDPAAGTAVLDRRAGGDCTLLMVSDGRLGQIAYERYGFSEKLECWQVAYYGEKPSVDAGVSARTADSRDLPMLLENYDLISPEEMEKAVDRESLLIGYHQGREIGFVGEHLEGSMGLLYVFPAYRRRGFGAALEKHMIARTMERGFVPFGQVEKDNHTSLRLQEKLGMTRSENRIVWMWK